MIDLFALAAPIGVEIDLHMCGVAQRISHRRKRGATWLQGSVAAPDAPERFDAAALAARVRELADRTSMRGRRVIVTAPPWHTHVAAIQLPPASSGAPLDEIAAAQLAESARVDPGDIESTWWALPATRAARAGGAVPATGPRPIEAMGVCMPRAAAIELYAAFENEGLDLIAIELRAAALARASFVGASSTEHARAASGTAARPREPVALVGGDAGAQVSIMLDIAWHASTLVVALDETVIFERVLPESGLLHLARALTPVVRDEAVAGHVVVFGLDTFTREEAASETTPTTPSARVGARVDDVMIHARNALRAWLDQIAQDALASAEYAAGICGMSLPPLRIVGKSPWLHAQLAERAAALGLSTASPPADASTRVLHSAHVSALDEPWLVAGGAALWNDAARAARRSAA